MSQIKSIRVTRSFFYGPTEYLRWCEEEGHEPTQKGFIEFIENDEYGDIKPMRESEEIEEEE